MFGPATATQPAHRRQPPKQTAVFVGTEAIAAATTGRIDGERIIVAAVRSARPEVRNVAVDLGTIRWYLIVHNVTGAAYTLSGRGTAQFD